MRLIAYVGVAISLTVAAHAAEISYRPVNGANVIDIVGPIVEGDAAKFQQVMAPLTGTTGVVLNSNGGAVGEGLTIGQAIHDRGYDTIVRNNAVCASVCGLIWLAGAQRFAGTTAHVGFHAAFRRDGGESGVANALIGAYLNRLGMSLKAIVYMTEKAPDEIQWLNADDAERLGIAFETLPDTAPQAAPAAPPHTIAEWLAGPTLLVPADQQAALTTGAYAEGRQDRINYEQWYASLPDSPYRDGATFWAGNRSLKPPPSCAGNTPEWQAGCVAARQRLAPVDVRRHAEKDYWFGWNSL